MLIPRLAISCIILIICFNGYSQKTDFSKVDNYAINLKDTDSLSIQELTNKLTDQFPDPIFKTKAIYTWIANNISYDCLAFHAGSKRKGNPIDVIKQKKAVCGGYANLFLEMCSDAKIQCLTIDGFARNGNEIFGEVMEEPNHTWNAVRINGEWKMIDVTWASGYTDIKVKQFTKAFSNIYFFTDPNKFLLNHYPKLDTWKPAKSNLSKKEFLNNPTVLNGYFENNINSFNKKDGIIKLKQDEPINFSLTTPDATQIKTVTIIIGEDKKKKVLQPDFKVTGNSIVFNFSYGTAGMVYPIVIYLNDIATLKYQLEIQ